MTLLLVIVYLKKKRDLVIKKIQEERQTLKIIGTLFNAIIKENTVLFSRKLSQNQVTASAK